MRALRLEPGSCSPDEILVTSGSLQGLDLVNTLLLGKGDTIIIERDTYGGALTRLARLGVKHKVNAYVPLVENMPSGTAIRPGDVRGSGHFTVVVTATTAPGVYSPLFTATTGGVSHSVSGSLVVVP